MVSDIEHKLLILFFGLVLVGSAVRTSDFVIFEYNRSVQAAEQEKERQALGQDKISFSGCNPCTRDYYETILPGQIIFLLAAGGLSLARMWGTYIGSVLTMLLILFGYLDWFRATYYIIIGSESSNHYKTPLSSYLLYGSTPLDFVLLLAISLLFAVQSGILIRFAAERIYTRIKFSDQTPQS